MAYFMTAMFQQSPHRLPTAANAANLPAPQATAQAALTGLVGSVGGAASLDRPSRRAFSRALSKFVTDMRGAVNVR